ncbi:MAG: DUF1566 domain-containing protein [Gammaproteobacteria bacterium HGW-Gammaproteobacteria-11]|nr:MAG: DUF1566 domain-containing protein [Gammaproteobacteria bacterium HGW-Gammaproteobacteria-11]
MNSLITVEVGTTRVETTNPALARNVLEFATGLQVDQEQSFASLLEEICPPRIGEKWRGQGGIYVGLVRGESGQPDYHLVVSESSAGQQDEIQWGSAGENEPDATNEWDGKANTEALANSEHSHPAAEWANGLNIEGHQDWYLPARRELALCYANVPEQFEKKWHWSSTQSSPLGAWGQTFVDGRQNGAHKDYALRARAVRRFVNHSAL